MNIQKRYRLMIAFICVLCMVTQKVHAQNIVATNHQKYSYNEMVQDIVELENNYPEYVHVNILGVTVDNRNIYDVVLGNPEAEKCIVVQASTHAREYMTSQLVMRQMEYYLQNYDRRFEGQSYRDIFNQVCVHVVPMTNPDGVTISQFGIKSIRSSILRKKLRNMTGSRYTRVWKANARGVDLNNQYNNHFKYVKKLKKGSYAGYGGRRPVSERESQALVSLVNTVNPKAVVNYHAMGSVIYCRYGGSKAMQKRVYRLSSKISKLTGYYYAEYTNNAGFANWLVRKKQIPSCTVEIGRYEAPVPISQFKTVWKENKNVMAASAKLYQ